MLRLVISWFLSLLVLSTAAHPQTAGAAAPNAEQEVRALQREWMDAMNKGDREALDRIIADNFTFIHSTGGMETKKQYIDRAAAGAQMFQRTDTQVKEEQLHIYGDDTAVWTSRVVMRNRADGAENSLQSTDVYVKNKGRWQWVAGQSTRLPTRPQPAAINHKLFKDYSGQYQMAAGRTLTVTEQGETLRAEMTGFRPAELVPKSETDFVWFNPENNVYSEITFVRNGSGQVSEAVFRREGVELWRGKKANRPQ